MKLYRKQFYRLVIQSNSYKITIKFNIPNKLCSLFQSFFKNNYSIIKIIVKMVILIFMKNANKIKIVKLV